MAAAQVGEPVVGVGAAQLRKAVDPLYGVGVDSAHSAATAETNGTR